MNTKTKIHNNRNADPNEVNKFAEMATYWWDISGPCKPLHDINPIRLSFIKQHTKLPNHKVLDVGCGGGILTEALATEGAIATGIDINEDLINIAKLHLLESGVKVGYQTTTIADYAKQHHGQFDSVVCMELLEHVPDPKAIVKACAEMVKPGGKLFFSTINRTPKAYAFAIIGAEYILHLLPYGTHDYAKFITPAELDQWARDADLNLTASSGMTYNPLTKHYKLTDDHSVNYMVCYQRES